MCQLKAQSCIFAIFATLGDAGCWMLIHPIVPHSCQFCLLPRFCNIYVLNRRLFQQSCISAKFFCNFGWCWTRIHPIVPRPFLPHRSAQKPPGRLNLRIHLFQASSIPPPFIQTPPPLHPPPHPQQLFVIRFLLVILSPKLLGQRYLRPPLLHLPQARNLSGGVIAMSDIFYN